MATTLSTKVLDRIFAFTGPFEGSIPYLYLDTVGRVTAGIGFMLPDVAAAKRLGFEPADKVEADFKAVLAAPKGKLAKWYRPLTTCTLPAASLRLEFDRRVNDFAATLVKGGYDLPSYPDDAVVSILDMAYNLGSGALLFKWPKFKASCLARDWKSASTQCVRKGIQQARNDATVALFLTAK